LSGVLDYFVPLYCQTKHPIAMKKQQRAFLSILMKRAHYLFKKGDYPTFAMCLKNSWRMAKETPTPTANVLFKKYSATLSTYLLNKVYTADRREVVEDIVQTTFIKVVENLHTYCPTKGADIKTWIFTIANNVLIDMSRKNSYKLKQCSSGEINDVQISTPQRADANLNLMERRNIVRSAMKKYLSEKEYRVLTMFMYEDYKYIEISEMLDISMSSVKVLILRAKAKLEKPLKTLSYA
jgi:RNA polymerase sigma-70 factor, ECF subfamily